MRSCDGSGILALISAALARDGRECFPQDLQINDLEDLVEMIPSEEVEIDCRGNLHVMPNRSAYINIGGVIKGPAYSKAITQLGTKLSVIAGLVHESCGVPDAIITCVGDGFIPWGERQLIASKEQKRALDDCLFCLDLHVI